MCFLSTIRRNKKLGQWQNTKPLVQEFTFLRDNFNVVSRELNMYTLALCHYSEEPLSWNSNCSRRVHYTKLVLYQTVSYSLMLPLVAPLVILWHDCFLKDDVIRNQTHRVVRKLLSRIFINPGQEKYRSRRTSCHKHIAHAYPGDIKLSFTCPKCVSHTCKDSRFWMVISLYSVSSSVMFALYCLMQLWLYFCLPFW